MTIITTHRNGPSSAVTVITTRRNEHLRDYQPIRYYYLLLSVVYRSCNSSILNLALQPRCWLTGLGQQLSGGSTNNSRQGGTLFDSKQAPVFLLPLLHLIPIQNTYILLTKLTNTASFFTHKLLGKLDDMATLIAYHLQWLRSNENWSQHNSLPRTDHRATGDVHWALPVVHCWYLALLCVALPLWISKVKCS